MEKELAVLLNSFVLRAWTDPRIGPGHISLYITLLCKYYHNKEEVPLYIFSHEIMPLCKLAGSATYHRSIRQLHQYGYIRYVPSHNQYLGSLVYLLMQELN